MHIIPSWKKKTWTRKPYCRLGNEARYREYPLQPLFRSVYSLFPKFDPRSIDLVTDLDNLRQLFDVVCGKSSPDFRIDIEVIENTVLLTRRSRKNKTYFREVMGYGHEFEKTFTQHPKGLRESGGHYRVIQYTLSGLNIVLRLE